MLAVCLGLRCVVPGAAAAEPTDADVPGILMVSIDDPDRPYVRDVQNGFRQALDEGRSPAVLYREYFDQTRFGDRPSYAEEFRAWLHAKYRDRRIDIIVVTQQPILELFRQAPDNPWNDVPVVSGTLGALTIDISQTHPTASGLVMENYFPRMLDVIRTILPEARRIAAIQGGSRSERARDEWWMPQVRQHGFEVMDLGGLTLEQLLDRVRQLPGDAVPFLFSFQTDASGRIFRPGQVQELIVAAANRPLFTLVGDDLDEGMLGGAIPDYVRAGRALGEHVLGRLAGRAPSVDILRADEFLDLRFDGRELVRWSIPESRLPVGSTVRMRPPNLWRDYRGVVIATVAIGAVLTTLLGVVLVERRNRGQAQAALQASYGQLQNLTDRLITAQEEERARIARDLHDDIGQRVASVSIALSRVKREVGQPGSPVDESLSELQHQASRLSSDLRQLSHDLHPSALEHLGLVQAIRARCAEFQEAHGVEVVLEVSDRWREVPDSVALCLYRVAQEALRNVAVHADARRVTVSLDRTDNALIMQVADDGRGFDRSRSPARPGLGLVSLGERVRMLGGRLDITAAPGAGTRIAVTLPAGAAHATQSASR